MAVKLSKEKRERRDRDAKIESRINKPFETTKEEDWKIYYEMLEKYKEEGTFGRGMIIGLAKDESNKTPWKDVPKEMEKLFHY